MCPALNYGKLIGNTLYYPGSELNGLNGLIDLNDDTKTWNNFQSRIGTGKGHYLEVILGIGAHRSVNPYSPLHKALWLVISEKIGFEIIAGSNLGTIRVNMRDIMIKSQEILRLGSALMFFATRCSRKNYDSAFALNDFGISIKEVF